MPNRKYKLNRDTLVFEAVTTPFRLRVYRFLRKLIIGFILASVVNFVFSYFFHTPKMSRIERDKIEVKMNYSVLNNKIGAMDKKLKEIKHRDNGVYRKLFAADSVSIPEVYRDYPESDYERLKNDQFSDILTSTWKSLDGVARLLYLESVSLDDLQILALDKERMSLSVPAIWPIDRKKMNRDYIGAFGMRNHPILHQRILHAGIDLSAPTGTLVYATGDGVVTEDKNRGGYGQQLLIDHGFGYKTRYAHLSKKIAVVGARVKRGEVIGEVGSTGRSTGPHLHYEVIYLNNTVDPVNYFRKDMSEEDFRAVIESAKATTFEDLTMVDDYRVVN